MGESNALSAADRLTLSQGGKTCDRCSPTGESVFMESREGRGGRKEEKVKS